MHAHRVTISLSVEKKLVFSALIIYAFAIFLPWMTESIRGVWWSKSGNFLFWSFMTWNNGKGLLFEKFWFHEPLTSFSYHYPIWNGLYSGWGLIFVFQILTLTYSLMHLPHGRTSETLREKHPAWLVVLPFATILLALYQLYIQKEIVYQNIPLVHSVYPHIGFWLATSSFTILLVARLAIQRLQLKNISKALKKSLKRTGPAIVILSIIAFFLIEELQFQSGVTKAMYVENRKEFHEIYENPELWEPHFSKITLVANLFRARVIYNAPKYAFCKLEVPVISYRMLQALLSNMGYVTSEPLFAAPLSNF